MVVNEDQGDMMIFRMRSSASKVPIAITSKVLARTNLIVFFLLLILFFCSVNGLKDSDYSLCPAKCMSGFESDCPSECMENPSSEFDNKVQVNSITGEPLNLENTRSILKHFLFVDTTKQNGLEIEEAWNKFNNDWIKNKDEYPDAYFFEDYKKVYSAYIKWKHWKYDIMDDYKCVFYEHTGSDISLNWYKHVVEAWKYFDEHYSPDKLTGVPSDFEKDHFENYPKVQLAYNLWQDGLWENDGNRACYEKNLKKEEEADNKASKSWSSILGMG